MGDSDSLRKFDCLARRRAAAAHQRFRTCAGLSPGRKTRPAAHRLCAGQRELPGAFCGSFRPVRSQHLPRRLRIPGHKRLLLRTLLRVSEPFRSVAPNQLRPQRHGEEVSSERITRAAVVSKTVAFSLSYALVIWLFERFYLSSRITSRGLSMAVAVAVVQCAAITA